jgi:hypothetical protein
MTTDAYLEKLEREHAQEIYDVGELTGFWMDTFVWGRPLPSEKRFLWWVRTYGLRLMKHAFTITAANASRQWSATRLGKYASAVARNIHEEATRAA